MSWVDVDGVNVDVGNDVLNTFVPLHVLFDDKTVPNVVVPDSVELIVDIWE